MWPGPVIWILRVMNIVQDAEEGFEWISVGIMVMLLLWFGKAIGDLLKGKYGR